MKVSEKQRQKHRSRIFAERDKNVDFLVQISSIPSQKKALNQTSFSSLLPKIKSKLETLDLCERLQWSSIITTKIKNIYARILQIKQTLTFSGSQYRSQQFTSLSKTFRQSTKLLVTLSSAFQIQYDCENIEEMLKKFYFFEYGDEVIVYFCAVDYECSKYRVFPPRKRPNLECCKEKTEKVEIVIDGEDEK